MEVNLDDFLRDFNACASIDLVIKGRTFAYTIVRVRSLQRKQNVTLGSVSTPLRVFIFDNFLAPLNVSTANCTLILFLFNTNIQMDAAS